MIDVCHYTEIAKSFDGDVLNAALKLGDGFGSLSASCYRCGKFAGL
jgi:hypothetical protein